eukprot:2274298-Prymnesium_polylepis.2
MRQKEAGSGKGRRVPRPACCAPRRGTVRRTAGARPGPHFLHTTHIGTGDITRRDAARAWSMDARRGAGGRWSGRRRVGRWSVGHRSPHPQRGATPPCSEAGERILRHTCHNTQTRFICTNNYNCNCNY